MFHKTIITAILLFFLLPAGQVLADSYTIGGANDNLQTVTDEGKTGITYRELIAENGGFLPALVKAILATTGFIFFILTIYGGFLWMTARGDDAKVEQGRNIVIQATIGLAIIVAAYAITTIVVGLATNTRKSAIDASTSTT